MMTRTYKEKFLRMTEEEAGEEFLRLCGKALLYLVFFSAGVWIFCILGLVKSPKFD